MSRRDEIIEKIADIPAIPAAAGNAMRLLRDPSKNMSEVIAAIQYDVGITADILKLVNSSAFATGRKISSLQEATVRLGANNILQMLIGSSMSKFMKQTIKGYDLPPGELWKSSMATAMYTDIIKDTLDLKLPNYTFTAGLLRDVGKIVLGSFINIDAEKIVDLAINENMSFSNAEHEVLGIDHAEVGAILLSKWDFPKELEVPVRWHHEPEKCEEDSLVTEIVHVADALTIMEGIGAGCEGLNYRLSETVVTKLGLDVDTIEKIIYKAQCRREEVKDLLD
jgi:HD-like signal output (HDOD) protein